MKRKRGRPRVVNKRRRVCIAVTEAERQEIAKAAEREGKPWAVYVREAALLVASLQQSDAGRSKPPA